VLQPALPANALSYTGRCSATQTYSVPGTAGPWTAYADALGAPTRVYATSGTVAILR
jgi:hypothetical protein